METASIETWISSSQRHSACLQRFGLAILASLVVASARRERGVSAVARENKIRGALLKWCRIPIIPALSLTSWEADCAWPPWRTLSSVTKAGRQQGEGRGTSCSMHGQEIPLFSGQGRPKRHHDQNEPWKTRKRNNLSWLVPLQRRALGSIFRGLGDV